VVEDVPVTAAPPKASKPASTLKLILGDKVVKTVRADGEKNRHNINTSRPVVPYMEKLPSLSGSKTQRSKTKTRGVWGGKSLVSKVAAQGGVEAWCNKPLKSYDDVVADDTAMMAREMERQRLELEELTRKIEEQAQAEQSKQTEQATQATSKLSKKRKRTLKLKRGTRTVPEDVGNCAWMAEMDGKSWGDL
jgi:hypothetical protein